MNGSHLLTLDNTKRYNKPPLFMKWPGYQLAIKSAKYTLSRRQYRRRQWHPTPVLLPGKSHGQRSLVGYSPWGHKESNTTERLHFHFSFSCIGEGNGNPLQCSCLENPRDGGAGYAAVYVVAQNWTRLKRLSSSSSNSSSMHVGHPLRFAPEAALENLEFPLWGQGVEMMQLLGSQGFWQHQEFFRIYTPLLVLGYVRFNWVMS